MRHIRVLVCQVDDETPDLMSELACFDLATPDVASLHPETALDAVEAVTQETGTAILRRLLHAQWDEIDAALVVRHCAQVAPAVVQKDGQEAVTVASRFGLLHLRRQVCVAPPCALILTHISVAGNPRAGTTPFKRDHAATCAGGALGGRPRRLGRGGATQSAGGTR